MALQTLGIMLGLGRVALAQPASTASDSPTPAAEAPTQAPQEGSTQRDGRRTTTSGESDEKRAAQSARHFTNGVNLYGDGNYAGALAEFEAAYALKPGAGALQNVALCLKALFRYAEAADQLDRLLSKHGADLEEKDRIAVREAIEELNALVGRVLLDVTPSDAQVTVDGTPVRAQDWSDGLRLNVGEHQVTADAAGYAHGTRVVRVAGGQDVTVKLKLRATAGFISVTTDDPDAAIAIDGRAESFHRWRGPVRPGRHLVQVYKSGFKPFERSVDVALGETARVQARLGPVVAHSAHSEAGGAAALPPPGPQQGWYALGVASVLTAGSAPRGVELEKEANAAGFSAGVRAGYRIWTPLGTEFLLEGGRHDIKNDCLADSNGGEDTASPEADCTPFSYSIDTFRLGGNLRLMSGGEKLRFTSTVGAGAVLHELQMQDAGSASGLIPYCLLEIGAQLNLGHLLLEVDFLAFVEPTAGIRGNLLEAEGTPGKIYDDPLMPLLGVGVRGGWSEWAPRQSAKLLQPAAQR